MGVGTAISWWSSSMPNVKLPSHRGTVYRRRSSNCTLRFGCSRNWSTRRTSSNPVDNATSQFWTLVLLDEVTSAEAVVRLSLRPGNVVEEHPVRLAQDRVLVAEQREHRLLPATKYLPGRPVRRYGRILWIGRDEVREGPRTGHRGLAVERSVVRGPLPCAQFPQRPDIDDPAYREHREMARESPPDTESHRC